jgi:hypothetical protein
MSFVPASRQCGTARGVATPRPACRGAFDDVEVAHDDFAVGDGEGAGVGLRVGVFILGVVEEREEAVVRLSRRVCRWLQRG